MSALLFLCALAGAFEFVEIWEWETPTCCGMVGAADAGALGPESGSRLKRPLRSSSALRLRVSGAAALEVMWMLSSDGRSGCVPFEYC